MFRSLQDRKKKLLERKYKRYKCRCDYCKQFKKKRLIEKLANEPIKEFRKHSEV